MKSENPTLTAIDLESMISREWRDVLDLSDIDFEGIASVLNSEPFAPPRGDIFNAINNLNPDDVKVIIIGQDPYHTTDVAHGFSFSVREDAKIPPSLKNIHKELMEEYDIDVFPENGSLLPWVKEGVLLLNTVLTVRLGFANSHKGIGWEKLTKKILRYIDTHNDCVFLAWGKFANDLCNEVVKNNEIISCGHPSPLNSKVAFVGCGCFKKTNESLMKLKRLPIRWCNLWDMKKLK